MAKKAAAPKTQRSIMSFFGAGASTPPPKKRKPVDDDAEKAKESPAKPVKKVKTSPKKETSKKTKKQEKPKPVEEEEEEENEEDVAMEEAQEMQVPSDEEEEAEKTKPKPGRRRLRQRVVEEEDSDSDLELQMTEKKKSEEEVIDLSSPSPAKVKSPVKEKQQKQKEEKPVTPLAVEEDEEDEEHDAEVDDTMEKVETPKKTSVASTKKTLEKTILLPSPVKAQPTTGFYTPQSGKKKTTSTPASDKKNKNDSKLETKKEESAKDQENDDGEPQVTPYLALANLFAKIEEVSGRLVIQDLLMNFFRDVIRRSPDDLLACIYLCVCVDLAPPFENLKIGIGDAILMKAIGEATGTNLKFIKEMYHKEGDLGKVAQNARSKQHTLSFTAIKPTSAKPSVLSVQHVYNQFVKIAKMTGNNSQQQKCSIIKGLLVKCEKEKKSQGKDAQSAEGARYIIRGLQGKLRIGLAEKSILMALTYAFMTEKDHKDKEKQQVALAYVKKAFAECPSYNALVAAFYEVQEEVPTAPFLRVKDFSKVAEKCVLAPGTPVSPMLARPTKAYAMVFDRFEGKPFTCEYKYDGERAQIHIQPNGDISIFSRNFENSTERFPDVKLAISSASKKSVVTSCIVDAEVVAVDRATNKRLPFQILSTRSRKNVKVEEIKVPVCIYAFDLLFLNGESFLGTPLAKRREKLREMFEVNPGHFEFASSLDVVDGVDVKDDADAMENAVNTVRTFLEEAVRENCEGLMVKTLEQEATYEPANRSHKWLKLKKDYLDGIGDSTDLVPIGAFFGRGKRTGVYGAYLLACYDPDTEMYQPITKLGTGLSDEVLKQFYEQLKEKVVDKPPSDYAIGDGIKPDVWFEASCVWEILGADLSISPKYTAAIGLVAKDKGISLRFPRFIRIRDDKDTTQATNSSQIADLYQAQGLASVSNGADDEDADMLI
ncbi:tRNA ligase [Phytophthora boehmeriae]|uniref:DNA ligase n=1 Tax=Phytophthora boehmeriae TaxID=109152 RepID=A0A8T1WT15_9STRA|nr:tRNA ligase [Phytophthora boehmeriae]